MRNCREGKNTFCSQSSLDAKYCWWNTYTTPKLPCEIEGDRSIQTIANAHLVVLWMLLCHRNRSNQLN